ncbi:DUF4240 domain-containing protein [Pseudoflavitalea sp. G-6-1-2]|uniref:DUF4240 domain-containing protein n=1 Tax=Pseudoflavitalea sp. G-6-1-2 TaxID=2728841 RepID=UPI00146D3854|nr:DUF4240 domain-containing protein [Pseudoflavitalea sp. G-6-1-2]NML22934.1 DUF4240 domain-containing protein [Pseudoflavitalea sp. G-6-1-2]
MNLDALEKSGQMMDEQIYWQLIHDSLKETSSQSEQEEYLIARLKVLNPQEIIGFHLRTDSLMVRSYLSELWCAAYINRGGCPDDEFEYFRCWLISRGKLAFYTVLEKPDRLVDYISDEAEEDGYEFESFGYVGVYAFERKTGKSIYSHLDDRLRDKTEGYVDIDFNWEEDDPASMKAICPALFAAREQFFEH